MSSFTCLSSPRLLGTTVVSPSLKVPMSTLLDSRLMELPIGLRVGYQFQPLAPARASDPVGSLAAVIQNNQPLVKRDWLGYCYRERTSRSVPLVGRRCPGGHH